MTPGTGPVPPETLLARDYRAIVVYITPCPYCGAPAGQRCGSPGQSDPLPYVHDDRSALHYLWYVLATASSARHPDPTWVIPPVSPP